MERLNKEQGITVISLIVAVIILVILASISIGVLNNGLIDHAGNAKDSAEIAGEKEILKQSVIVATVRNKYNSLTEKGLQQALDSNIGEEGKAEVIEEEESYIVHFIDSNRYYEVDDNGNISTFTRISDKTPGDITKNKDGNALAGTEEEPYEIWSIEDLVAFSIMTNGGNSSLGLASNTFNNKYVKLCRTLNFDSKLSYEDYKTTIYGNLNGDGTTENLITELTKKDEGCKGFGGIKGFKGTFDGNENTIENLYQNVSSGSIALFASTCTIKKLSVMGNITTSSGSAAGICVSTGSEIYACKNYATVTGTTDVGGVCISGCTVNNCINYGDIIGAKDVGGICATNCTVEGCANYGNITKTTSYYWYCGVGGICGTFNGNRTMKNCINEGTVTGPNNGGIVGVTARAGGNVNINGCINKGEAGSGIAARAAGGTTNILNCINLSDTSTNGFVGMFGSQAWTNVMALNIKNSCNLGKVTNGFIGTYGHIAKSYELNMENCYTAGIASKGIVGTKDISATKSTETTNISNTYYNTDKTTNIGVISDGITGMTDEEMKSETFLNTLNTNIGGNADWCEWVTGDDGYPVLNLN